VGLFNDPPLLLEGVSLPRHCAPAQSIGSDRLCAGVHLGSPRGHLRLRVHLAPHHLLRDLPTPDGLQQALTFGASKRLI
jgi:hypothetical protein